MQSVLIDTNEWNAARFEDLCDMLECDTPEERSTAFGYLFQWYLRWAGDQDLDAGLFWNISEKRMGGWSGYPSALKFGRVLIKSGYCKPVADVYPEALCAGRSGFVVMGAMDRSWDGIHKKRANARELVLYLQDPVKRSKRALSFPFLMTAEDGPPGWLMPLEDAAAEPDDGPTTARRRPDDGIPPNGGGSAAAPPSRVPREQRLRINLRNVNNQEPPGGAGGTTGTENTKTWQQFDRIRELKNITPLKALDLIDSSRQARLRWHDAFNADPSAVCQLLSTMTETRQAWMGLASPARVAMSKCKKIIAASRHGTSREGGAAAERGAAA